MINAQKLRETLPGEALLVLAAAETAIQADIGVLQSSVIVYAAIIIGVIITGISKYFSQTATTAPPGSFAYRRELICILCGLQALCYSISLFSSSLVPSEWVIVAAFICTAFGILLTVITAYI